jgi:hypothetical protein
VDAARRSVLARPWFGQQQHWNVALREFANYSFDRAHAGAGTLDERTRDGHSHFLRVPV